MANNAVLVCPTPFIVTFQLEVVHVTAVQARMHLLPLCQDLQRRSIYEISGRPTQKVALLRLI